MRLINAIHPSSLNYIGQLKTLASNQGFPPGRTLMDWAIRHHLSTETMAGKLDMTAVEYGSLLNGDTYITRQLAERLAEVTGLRANFWCTLDFFYRKALKG